MTKQDPKLCPHCGEELTRWYTPQDSSWAGEIHLVCFHDRCPYFVKGWLHMYENFEVKASYRYCLDPGNDKARPLPTWSKGAHREWIVPDGEGEQS